MSGFFQLRPGSQSNQGNQQSQEIPPFFLYHPSLHYRNLELWHAQQQQQQQQGGGGGESSNMSMDQASEGHEIVPAVARAAGWGAMRGVGLAGGGGGGGGGRSCQDCGNQAKKDCSHLRCRTCCKSRGFHCDTHVKSTWVPASRRRERQFQRSGVAVGGSAVGAGESSKRLRENPHQTSCTRLQLPSTASGGMTEVGSFPPEVSSPAVFRCVRVSGVEEPEEQYAYQTSITIGGHLFRGILYDQGAGTHDQHHHRTLPATGESSAGVGAPEATSATSVEPTPLYAAPLSAFMAGTQFFPHARS